MPKCGHCGLSAATHAGFASINVEIGLRLLIRLLGRYWLNLHGGALSNFVVSHQGVWQDDCRATQVLRGQESAKGD